MGSERRKFRMVLAFAVLFATLAFVSFGCASAATYTVCPSGCDYTSIQVAIDAADPGDTIEVHSGTYYENVDVNKQLILSGVDTGGGKPVVDAGGSGSAITLSAAGITLKSFTVTNSGISIQNAGIMSFLNSNTITDNIASYNGGDGIALYYRSNNTITDNIASYNGGSGIYLDRSSNNTLTNNIACDNDMKGIDLYYSSNNTLTNNNVSYNKEDGINLWNSSNNTITGNNASYNKEEHTGNGIYISGSSNTITDNNASYNGGSGIYLYDSCNSIITGNNFCENGAGGIGLGDSSNKNNIIGNNVCNNYYGIDLGYSNNNILTGNIVSDNDWIGIILDHSSNNKIYLNNFINNDPNVYSEGLSNVWNSPEKISYVYEGTTYENYTGNHWSDYTGSDADGDGIGDTPHSISGDNPDRYPLMEPFENYLAPPENQPPIAIFTYSPENPVVNQTMTFDASSCYDLDGRITSYEWNFGDGNITSTTEEIITHFYPLEGNYTVNLTVTDDEGATNTTAKAITVLPLENPISDTGSPENPYPSIFGTRNGTITPNLTESIKLYENSELIASGTWNGYQDDYHNITITPSVILSAEDMYNYTIVTGSYPQIIHAKSKDVTGGTITCTSFVDVNGKTCTDWIPAIKLE